MIKNFFKITFRNLAKNKIFAIINIAGLGIALACCVVAYLNWNYNIKFDTNHKNADKIYRINYTRITNGAPKINGNCPMPLGDIVRNNFGQVSGVARYYPTGGNFKVEDELFRTSVAAVDPDFFSMFTFEMMYGSGDVLKDKSRILISDELKAKYFPDMDDPTGEIITYINGEERLEYLVGGVFKKPPQNSSFYYSEAFVHFDNVFDVRDWDKNDWSLFNTTFIEVDNPENIPDIEKQLQEYVEIQNRAKEDWKVERYYLDPFAGMAIRATRNDIFNHWTSYSLPVSAAVAPGIMAILLLLLACFNFTNTSIAIANRRLKEIGLRKVMGSQRGQLIFQFLSENILLAFFGLILGLLIAYFLVPAYSQMWQFLDIKMDFRENLGFYGFLVLLLIFTGVIAGSYPAFYISGFKPASILRGNLKYGGTNTFTRVLLTMQYAISLIAIISGFLFAQNAQYQKNYDMGFNMESVIFSFVENDQGFRTFKNALSGNPDILSIAGSGNSMTSSWYTDPLKFETQELDVDILDIGYEYLHTVGSTIIEGRNFIEDSQNDVENAAIVNEELVRTLGWDEPIGKRFILKDTTELYVVGVVKDIHVEGALWDPLEPMVLRFITENKYRFLSVRTELEDIREVHDYMESKWREVFPDKLPDVRYMEQQKVNSAEINTNIKIIFIFLGVVALILSVIGLYSLMSLNIIKRIKEIGVRKVLGASVPNIVATMSREFVIIILIASVIGSVTAYYLTDMMMASIWTYYLPIGPISFAISVFLMILVSAITVGGKVINAATLNPANTLRDE